MVSCCSPRPAFTVGGQRVIAELGLGLAVAVAMDALLLRLIAVPALMHLAGRSSWWLPRWLDRALPRLAVESGTDDQDRLAGETRHGTLDPREPDVARR